MGLTSYGLTEQEIEQLQIAFVEGKDSLIWAAVTLWAERARETYLRQGLAGFENPGKIAFQAGRMQAVEELLRLPITIGDAHSAIAAERHERVLKFERPRPAGGVVSGSDF